jgi:hypothetical protein
MTDHATALMLFRTEAAAIPGLQHRTDEAGRQLKALGIQYIERLARLGLSRPLALELLNEVVNDLTTTKGK